MRLTHEHEQVRDTVRRWIGEQVNPYVDAHPPPGSRHDGRGSVHRSTK